MAENPVHKRDGWQDIATGRRAESVHHRIHGDRSNNRPSCLLSVSGSGTTLTHGWIEQHWTAAAERGWTVTKYGRDTALVAVWYEFGPFGRGWYGLDDEYGFWSWPGCARMLLELPEPPPVRPGR